MLGSNSNKHVLVKGGGLWKIDCKIEATVSYCVPFFYSNISPIYGIVREFKENIPLCHHAAAIASMGKNCAGAV